MTEENGFVMNADSLPKGCLSRLKVSGHYILHSAVNNISETKVAVSLSTNDILIYDIESQAKVTGFKGHDETVTEIKFSQNDPQILFSSSLDGTLMQWDLRKGMPVNVYTDKSGSKEKPFTCFDYDASENYICAGTEVVMEDSFLVFWDKRMTNPVGGYWNSHYDEITQVKFYASGFYLASSSLDGLINIYDLSEGTEDDALQNTLNSDSSIHRFCLGVSDTVVCLTKDDAFQFWCSSEVKPHTLLSRKQISEDFMCDVDYLIDTFNVDTETYLASGSNDGCIQLYSCSMKGLKIICEFRKGHSSIIRTINHCKNKKVLITGGEDGVMCTWKSPLL